jgi:hypothetical protein
MIRTKFTLLCDQCHWEICTGSEKSMLRAPEEIGGYVDKHDNPVWLHAEFCSNRCKQKWLTIKEALDDIPTVRLS